MFISTRVILHDVSSEYVKELVLRNIEFISRIKYFHPETKTYFLSHFIMRYDLFMIYDYFMQNKIYQVSKFKKVDLD